MRFFPLERLSVKTRFFLAIFGPSFLVLLVATAGAFISDVIALRHSLETRAETDAELLANATRPALSLDDNLAAKAILDALQSNGDILGAAIYRNNGELFCGYQSSAATRIPAVPRARRVNAAMEVVVPIEMGTEQIGQLWLEFSLARYYARLRYYSLAVLAALLLLSTLAAGLARFFQAQFSIPLRELAAAAQRISGDQDYSVRAPTFEFPEFKALTEAFNHMLETIEKQNMALTERTVQLEKTNSKLSTANKELEAFTYTVSHDLRTPLRAISSYAQLLREDLGENLAPQSAEFMERIQKNAVKMAQLIDELLAFSRLDAHPLERSKVDMSDIVQQVWNDLTAESQNPTATLQLDELPWLDADPLLLRQVFLNLLGNALKYSRTRPAPVVTVGCFKQEGERVLFVKDNGVGFNMKYANKLFGIFQRLHRDDEFEGTGVGLAIVHRIITRHGGRVWAESQAGEGATFFFTLGE